MVFEFEFDDKTKFLVIYQHVTKKAESIHKYTGIALSTIYYWIDRIKNDVDIFQRNEGQGAKVTIDEEVKQELFKEVENHPQTSTSRRLALEFNIGKTTVLGLLHEKGLVFKVVKKNEWLTLEQKEERRG